MMKKNILLMMLLALAVTVAAQEKKTVKDGPGFWGTLGNFFLPHLDNRKILLEKQTRYFQVTVEEDYQGWRHLVFNPCKGSQGMWNPEAPDEIVSRYCRFSTLFLPALEQSPRKVLFIGMGAGIVPRFVRRNFPEAQIDMVEIDDEIPGIAENFFGFKKDDKMKIIVADGRDYLNRTKEKYDLIFIDAYNAEAIPFQLTTLEFFQKVRAAMAPGGLMLANIANLGKSEFIAGEIHTAREVFPDLSVFICGYGANYMLLTHNDRPIDSDKIKARAELLAKTQNTGIDYGDIVDTRMSTDDLGEMAAAGMILKDDFAPVETMK